MNKSIRKFSNGKRNEKYEKTTQKNYENVYFNEHNIKNKIKARGKNQQKFEQSIDEYQLTVAVGYAGCGKTLLSVKKSLEYYFSNRVSKIIITRPVIETGESLGYLPGTFDEKMNPYMIPIFDSFNEIIGEGQTKYLYNSGKIEISPLAYMRGRTIKNCFCILDEAQNTSIEQMKMFLTRIGEFSKFVINGDESQSDLKFKTNGLVFCKDILQNVDGTNIIYFDDLDIQRSPIVTQIVKKIELYEKNKNYKRNV